MHRQLQQSIISLCVPRFFERSPYITTSFKNLSSCNIYINDILVNRLLWSCFLWNHILVFLSYRLTVHYRVQSWLYLAKTVGNIFFWFVRRRRFPGQTFAKRIALLWYTAGKSFDTTHRWLWPDKRNWCNPDVRLPWACNCYTPGSRGWRNRC